jgi:hypothetical protein
MKSNSCLSTILLLMLCPGSTIQRAQAQQPTSASGKTATSAETANSIYAASSFAHIRAIKRAGFDLTPPSVRNLNAGTVALAPAAANLKVLGSGTLGRLTRWTGFTSSNAVVGDSTIFEDKFGLVGIGTDTPTSKLTVNGLIQSLGGGFKFPDGTVQTTAAVGGLTSIFHDSTLTGNGTSGAPLGVAVPLFLTGAVDDGNAINGAEALVDVTNTAVTGAGIIARGNSFGVVGLSDSVAVLGRGGDRTGSGFRGGTGVSGAGGAAADGIGGIGVVARGGEGSGAGNAGGIGIDAEGGAGANGATNGLAGKFTGDVLIDGNLNVLGTKNFKIDHPLDPENKYLYHAAIESSEVLNIYSGNVRLDATGAATVKLPEWFEALNKDFRYSLTPIGAPAQGLYIAEEVSNSRFKIAGGLPGAKVSWQVTGVRSDAALRLHPFKVEEDKPERERGRYLNSAAYGQTNERSVELSRHAELMRQMKETRAKQFEERKEKPQLYER